MPQVGLQTYCAAKDSPEFLILLSPPLKYRDYRCIHHAQFKWHQKGNPGLPASDKLSYISWLLNHCTVKHRSGFIFPCRKHLPACRFFSENRMTFLGQIPKRNIKPECEERAHSNIATLKKKWSIYFNLMYIGILPACMSIQECLIPGEWNYRQLWAAMWLNWTQILWGSIFLTTESSS